MDADPNSIDTAYPATTKKPLTGIRKYTDLSASKWGSPRPKVIVPKTVSTDASPSPVKVGGTVATSSVPSDGATTSTPSVVAEVVKRSPWRRMDAKTGTTATKADVPIKRNKW